MKKQLPVGLVVEGNVTKSAVLRLPGIGDHVGPVFSNTLRVARRFTNAFRAGDAVESFGQLGETRLVIFRIPDSSLARIVDQFCASEIHLEGMCFAVCETWLASDSLSPLRERGAFVATVSTLPGAGARWFITEGDRPALRQVRLLLESSGARVIALRAGTKPLFFAAEYLATVVPLPLFSAAQVALRAAGISGKVLTAVTDRLAQRLIKNIRAGNRLAHSGPFQPGEDGYTDKQLQCVRDVLPEAAGLSSSTLEQLLLAGAFRHRRERTGLPEDPIWDTR